MTTLRIIFPDQLSKSISSLEGLDKNTDGVMICEYIQDLTSISHHSKKIAFILSAMRHFAKELIEDGINTSYIQFDALINETSFLKQIKKVIQELNPLLIIVTKPSEFRLLKMINSWKTLLNIPTEILDDTRFLCSDNDFKKWVKDKKQLRMEFFYREMRKKYSILIDSDGSPTGGRWNYDKENRKPPSKYLDIPPRLSHKKSFITKDVLALVKNRFSKNFGILEPFHYAVTRDEALKELDHFIKFILPKFGDYQDAMLASEPYLYHSLISSYLNVGLLLPLEVCKKAEIAYNDNLASINCVEGFIRQILGWREYIRGIYWHFMPEYANLNSLNATITLPDFYWTTNTKMFCVAEAVTHTRDHAYSHHIQRLMITGNFALIAGLDVKQVQQWYLAVYSDAFEWVEMPNTLGMSLFGDNGIVASKPYAASGKYINRMSNYCKKCYYDPNQMTGEKSCPFNSLYWDFLVRHEDKFRGNQRMPFVFTTWDKFTPEKKQEIRTHAKIILQKMSEGIL